MEHDDRLSVAGHEARAVSLGELRVEVSSDEPSVVRRFDRLFAAFPGAGRDADDPASTIRIDVRRHRPGTDEPGADDPRTDEPGADDLYASTVDADTLIEAAPLAQHELRITRLLNDRKLDAEPHLLHLHSAAVALDGRAAVLVGRSGRGKSSLTAALVRDGWQYVTDEIVTVDPSDGRLHPYPRPLTLREGTWPDFPELGPYPEIAPGGNGMQRVEIPPFALGAVAGDGSLEPVAVVFPHYDPEHPAGLHAVGSAAETVEQLALCCYDLERVGIPGFQVLVDWAAGGSCWSFGYDDLALAVGQLTDSWHTIGPTRSAAVSYEPATVEVIELPSATVRRTPSSHGWLFEDGSAVVFDPADLKISRLDAAGFDLWRRLASPQSVEQMVVADADSATRQSLDDWLDVMVSAGFVERAAPAPS